MEPGFSACVAIIAPVLQPEQRYAHYDGSQAHLLRGKAPIRGHRFGIARRPFCALG
jgi:hypothetical protein